MDRHAQTDLKVEHRLATMADAGRLFDIRRQAITELATPKMSTSDAQAWAAALSIAGMEQKLRELEVWVAEVNRSVLGWGAIGGDRLEGLYTDPKFAGRGIGTSLLGVLETVMKRRGITLLRAEASRNAETFYLRRGYERTEGHTAKAAHPIQKRL